ncbi:signal peptidase I [Cellulomonas dongxiuzhuiae]|uniref:Signal peptidase I n=1 Tax=Cellulomonas dongxiuzhuiae TaxID=2819979 RepID=A0ABX8GHV5_9CELL|nr:signal peptidase I [Cellulomonas dongxiuzhuiae]MBO3094186.1 signal peptidase I [Cellulomonas dongxiuzhuiae]QWC15241.1 signal peptidase I [Cellulomonas dongxiuzhuiae]
MTATRAPRDSWSSGVLSAVTTALVLAVLVLAVALTVVPRMLDGAALTVLTGSMVPTYDPGDVVVVRGVKDAATEVRVGDVVSFQPLPDDPTLVTHRVVSFRSTADGPRWVTRGDANGADDEPLQAQQIKAEVVYHVPYVGHVTLAAGQHRSTIVVGAAIALVVYGAWMVLSPDRARRAARDAAADPAVGLAEDPTDADATAEQRASSDKVAS